MSDLISRDEAIKAIKKRMGNKPLPPTEIYTYFGCIDEIKALPSAEPKTGECKDCTYWDKLNYEAPRQGWCNRFEDWTDADEFCSRCARMRGEKK